MAIDLKKHKPSKRSKESSDSDWWAFMNKDIELFGKSFGAKQKAALYAELETLLVAGLDIQAALELIEDSQSKKKIKAIITSIKEAIIAGATLSQAMEQTGKFSLYEVFSIQIGEEAGKLHEVLKELAAIFNKTLKYRRQLTSALSYPIFVLSFSFLAVFFLLRYLVPMFSDIYVRFDNELPGITQFIVDLSDSIGKYAPYMGISFFVIIVLIYTQRKRTIVRKVGAIILTRMPIFGGIIKRLYLARFCQAMSLLLSARVPLLRTVQLVRQMLQFYPIETSLQDTEESILHGQNLYQALQPHSFYPKRLLALIRVGEEASQLDLMFQRLAEQYNSEVDEKTALISNLLEPVLIVFLGLIVGVILVAMYLPLFQLSAGMGM